MTMGMQNDNEVQDWATGDVCLANQKIIDRRISSLYLAALASVRFPEKPTT